MIAVANPWQRRNVVFEGNFLICQPRKMDLTVAKESESLGKCVVSSSESAPSLIPVSIVIYSKGAVSSAVNALCFNLRLRARCTYTLPASARTLSAPTCGMCIILEKPSRKCVISPRLPSTWRARILPCPRRSAGMHATVR